ncbi:multidrug effflux MFS transporter [Bauldia sp.]|uniref:multidrug effflux MFS transporter n=1 Tax=Bauldia sp. TaxID=2575872 RepID=UPI003BAB1576
MQPSFLRSAIVLGLLAAAGPFAIDMYLPALPSIADDLSTTTAATQMTLMVYFVAFGVCQLVYGPVSDMVGRKPPLYFGLTVFAIGSIGCAFAPSIGWLIAFRLVQGVGAASVMVIPRAIIRDMHTGVEATRLMALVMLVISVSPILAPLVGSALIVPFGWRSVFVAITLVAAVGFVMLAVFLPETRPEKERIPVRLASLLSGFGQLLVHGRFLGLTFIGGLGMASFFTFLAASSFVYIEHFGLTPTEYALAFSVNAIGFFGVSQMASWLGARFGMGRAVFWATGGFALFSVVLFVATLAGADSLAVLMPLIFLAFACLGVVIPTTMVLALDDHGPIAGIASALGGTLQMVSGAVMIVVVSLTADGTTLPMVTIIAACGIGALLLAWLTLGRDPVVAQVAE